MRARVRIPVLVGCLLGMLGLAARAGAVGLQTVGNFDHPIFVTAPAGDPRLFVVERPGYIQVLHDGTRSPFLDIHTIVDGDLVTERGLLSMAFDPSYAANGLFYVFYIGNGAGGGADGDVHVDEFHVSSDPNAADPASRRTVWTFSHSASNHNGGQLQFGKDGLLYISVGDNANSANAQSLANPYGKILRINPHGAGSGDHGIPADNPFVGISGATPEIWSLGLRNPFRFSFDRLSGDLIIGDVGSSGPDVAEEVNFAPTSAGLARGANFGWPNCEGFSGACTGTTLPILAYPHSDPGGGQAFGCAVIGGYVYRGSRAPELAGRYLYSDLCNSELRSLGLATPLASGDRSEGIDLPSHPYAFGEDANCDLYAASGDGLVTRIVGSAASAAPACTSSPATPVTAKKKKKCKKRRHHKKHRAAESKKHKKKRCKKHKKKHRAAI